MRSPANIASAPINLDHPGTYLHWSIFTVSVANLCLIAVMVVIFGAALLLPFPKGRTYPPVSEEEPDTQAEAAGADEDRDMWTNRVRRFATRILPPGKLLPDRQPAYVRSWIYVFGVGSLAAFGVAIVSGFALALGGPDWWHYNPVGHFFNSLHLWSVELFMALLVIHLWGKFWMAAWRGKRAWTWITGVVAFMASVIECFTGYVSQQNFDSQWISASGKDAFNPVGVGAFFNIMNFGQMLMWHIVLVPIVLVAIIGAHVLLVRVRGVSHPLPAGDPPPGPRHPRAAPPGPGREGRRTLAWSDPPLRHPQGRHHRQRDHPGAHVRPGQPAVLARRALGHRPDLGQGRPGRLPGHVGHRTQRHERQRHLRAAVQQRHRQRPEAAVLAGPAGRGPPAAAPGAGLRPPPAEHDRLAPTPRWAGRWPPTGPPRVRSSSSGPTRTPARSPRSSS